MSEIRVFPGVSIETEGGQLALKFIRMIGETQEAYVERCQQVANLALSFVPKSEPATFDFSDTSKYRKINEHSYELIAPGYHPTEETGEEDRMHPLIERLSQAVKRGRSLTEETPIDSEKLRMYWTHEMLPAMLDLWQELVRTDEDAQFIQRQIDDWEKIMPAMTELPEQEE